MILEIFFNKSNTYIKYLKLWEIIEKDPSIKNLFLPRFREGGFDPYPIPLSGNGLAKYIK